MKAAEKENKISLEDLIERERAALGPNQTKITLETFSKAHDQNSNYFFMIRNSDLGCLSLGL